MKRLFIALMTLTITFLIGTAQKTYGSAPLKHTATHTTADITAHQTADITPVSIPAQNISSYNYRHMGEQYMRISTTINTDNTLMATITRRISLPKQYPSPVSKYINSNQLTTCINCLINSNSNGRAWRNHLHVHQDIV